jgi:hypothetical protein
MVGLRLPVRNSTLVSYYSVSRELKWNGCMVLYVKITGGVEANKMCLFYVYMSGLLASRLSV